MLIKNFEWFLKGTNEKGQKIEMTLDRKAVQRLFNMLYLQSPDATGLCDTCKGSPGFCPFCCSPPESLPRNSFNT